MAFAEQGGIELQYMQVGYPIYKETAEGAEMLSETFFPQPRIIKPDAQFEAKELIKDELGKSLPAEQVKFEQSYGDFFALTVKGKGESKAALIYQDIAYLKTGQEKHPLMILAYQGCPFSVKELRVLPELAMRELTIIEIDSCEKDILIPSKTSSVPFIVTVQATVPCYTTVNMQWKFLQSGLMFETADAKYKVLKAGATISFTADGVKLDGVEKL